MQQSKAASAMAALRAIGLFHACIKKKLYTELLSGNTGKMEPAQFITILHMGDVIGHSAKTKVFRWYCT